MQLEHMMPEASQSDLTYSWRRYCQNCYRLKKPRHQIKNHL